MSEPNQTRAVDVVKRAMSLPPGKRRAFIAETCKDEPDLLRLAVRVLDQQESATLVDVSVTPTNAVEAPFSAGTGVGLRRVGTYSILEVLGEGGMGVVYLARQENPSRTVALKVIRAGVLTPRMLRRFEHETQILGRLQHPGIAQIYDAGTADTGAGPVPYFAMELVRGEPLTHFVASQRLNVAQKIDLFTRVCDAVEHAHQKGVIHRDLKPGNILVNDKGEPKVLDFGVARATDADMQTATMQTEAGQLLGTVPYMSPEQIAGDPGDLDTRSDVYTLGVILFEMLAGRLPHAVADCSIAEAVRIISQEEPTPLGSVDRSLRGDVQTIVSKSLERDKARRYPSARALADDLRRFRSDEPITARPASTTYQLTKFARRYRGLVSVAAAGVLVLILGVIAASWQAARATRGEQLAEARRQEAEAARATAVEEAEISGSTNRFLTDMLAGADPEATQGRDVTVRELLDTAAQTLDTNPPSRPRVAASVRSTLATTYEALGKFEPAEAQARRVLADRRASLGENHADTIQAQRTLARVLAGANKYEEGEALARDAATRAETVLGKDHETTIEMRGEIARIIHETGRQDEAMGIIEQAIRDFAAIGVSDRDDRVLTLKHNLGTALKDAGRLEESEKLLREVLNVRIEVFGEENPRTLYSFNGVAAVLSRLGRQAESAELFERALAARRKVLGPDHPGTLTLMSNLAATYVQLKRFDKAEPLLRDAIRGLTALVGEGHSRTQIAMGNLAYLLDDTGRTAEAEAMFRKLVSLRREASGGRDPETWAPMNNLAMLVQRAGKPLEADGLFRELLDLCKGTIGTEHYYYAIFENNHGDCLVDLKRFDEAQAALLHSHPLLEKMFKPTGDRTLKSIRRLVRLYNEWEKPQEAEVWRAKLPPTP